MGRIRTERQRKADERNFNIFRLRGARQLFIHLDAQYELEDADLCARLCVHMIRKIKAT